MSTSSAKAATDRLSISEKQPEVSEGSACQSPGAEIRQPSTQQCVDLDEPEILLEDLLDGWHPILEWILKKRSEILEVTP